MTPLLFDMDGLLLDTERVAMQSFMELTDALGMAADTAEQVFLGLIGSSATQTRDRLAAILPAGVDADAFGGDWSARFRELVADGVPLRTHAEEVVAGLAKAGHAMAVVTSTKGHHAREQLEQAGLYQHFHHVIGGDEVAANKPDPAPYQAGAAALGVDARDCIAFEDSDMGVASAVAAGCRVFQIPDLRPVGKPLPKLGQTIAPDLREAVRLAGLS